ncbi:MAG: flagellar biosynthesis protein FlhB [Actinomycetota bacterium]|nr:flagellar biosynthesis protein FlhB [Actinomycetota bacterium]
MAGEKTEKATPKRLEEARKKGQVARSTDVNGAAVLAAGLAGLALFGPRLYEAMRGSMHDTLSLISTPGVVEGSNLGAVLGPSVRGVALAVAPVAAMCLLAGVAASVGQVKWKPSGKIVKPDPKRINPLSGFKNIFGPHSLFEAAKAMVKVTIVGGIAALAVFPELPQFAALVGLSPAALGARLASMILDVALRAVAAYLVIAAIDYAYQRWRFQKQMRMDKQEVKDELKQYQPPAEVKNVMRRRQMQAARARMMDAVPQADVVVTNPTHYAVALAYDAAKPAPEVVAKGKDLIAAQIKRIAEEHGVPVISDPPLARGLHHAVEVGHGIPEDFFAGVAQLLAFVYRVAGRRAV